MVTGEGHQDVIKLVSERIRRGRESGGNRRLGLVVEGGAMRGTCTAGSLLGLHLLGGAGVFDSVYATSAGALNAAHFLSGAGHLKAATYYRALADGRFYNPWRLHMPVDIDFVFDVVLRKEIPLEMDRLAQSPSPFKVALLNCDDASPEMKTVSGGGDLAWNTLKASVAMPVVYNKTVPLPGGRYVDGGMAIPYPLREAIRDGMTDLVVCLSRSPVAPASPRGLYQYVLWSTVFAKWRPALVNVFENWLPTVRRLDSMVMGREPMPAPVRILLAYPAKTRVWASTQDRRLLREECLAMTREMLGAFGQDDAPLEALIRDGVM